MTSAVTGRVYPQSFEALVIALSSVLLDVTLKELTNVVSHILDLLLRRLFPATAQKNFDLFFRKLIGEREVEVKEAVVRGEAHDGTLSA